MNAAAITIIILVLLAVIVAVVTFYCMCKKKVQPGRVVRPPQQPQVLVRSEGVTSSPSGVVPRNGSAVHNNNVYMVPISALPANFDYTARGIEVRGDVVVLQDLSLLDPHTNYEAFRQSPYNPNVCHPYNQQNMNQYNAGNPPPYTPSVYPNVHNVSNEAYQKQASYNPGYSN